MTVWQPADVKFSNADGSVALVWNKSFAKRWGERFLEAQVAAGKTALRLCEPYIPLRTGRLVLSGKVDEEGNLSWHTPYARHQYYRPNRIGSSTGKLRGPYWFHRMKATHKKQIVGAAKEAVGK